MEGLLIPDPGRAPTGIDELLLPSSPPRSVHATGRKAAIPQVRLSKSAVSSIDSAARAAREATAQINELLALAALRQAVPADTFAQVTRQATKALQRGRDTVERVQKSGKQPAPALVTSLLALARDGHQYECAVEQWRLLHSGSFAQAGNVFDPLEDSRSEVAAELSAWFASLVASDLLNDMSGERFHTYMNDWRRIIAWPRGEQRPDLPAVYRAFADSPGPVEKIRLHTVLAAITTGIMAAENVRVVELERQEERRKREEMESLITSKQAIDPAAFCHTQ